MIDRRTFLKVATGLAACTPTVHAGAAEISGIVTMLLGKASVRSADVERAVKEGDAVQIGDLLRTFPESRLSMKLGQSTIINLGPATKLRIERHLTDAGGEFELVEGSMFYQHAHKPTEASQKSLVRSPYGLLAVRGTKFFAGPSQRDAFAVFVAEGRVDVTAAGTTVELYRGFGCAIRRRGGKPSSAGIWRANRIAEALFKTTGRRAP